MNPEPAAAANSDRQPQLDPIYIWGRPASTYLAPRQVARLMIMRAKLDDRHLLRNRIGDRAA